jgi:hypothetical protein
MTPLNDERESEIERESGSEGGNNILRAKTKISGFECSQEVPARPSGKGVLENRQSVRK